MLPVDVQSQFDWSAIYLIYHVCVIDQMMPLSENVSLYVKYSF